MYRLGDIVEYSYLKSCTMPDGSNGFIRVFEQALVREIIAPGKYEVLNITEKRRGLPLIGRKEIITDNTPGFRRVGNIWESSLTGKVGCAQRKQPR